MALAWLATAVVAAAAAPVTPRVEPGGRVLLDAHNCYPEGGRWADRLDRALSTGTPIAIEQDLVWYGGTGPGRSRSLVAHDRPEAPDLGLTGREPTLDAHFFERIRPIVEAAFREDRRDSWPLVTLNLDFKTEEPEHLAAAWSVLERYAGWLTTAPRAARLDDVQPLRVGPVLVLTGSSEAQQRVFHDARPPGSPLLVFGASLPRLRQARTPSEARVRAGLELPDLVPGPRTNYHRWWNNPWSVVELGGATAAGPWTPDDERRLRDLVRAAHAAGLWIRFYTLDGHDPADQSRGWSEQYNFGSLGAVRERWRAAVRAGVDFVATDQYEDFAALRHAEP